MSLGNQQSVDIHDKTGDDKEALKNEFDAGHMSRVATSPDEEPMIASLIYQIGLLKEDIDELRRYLTAEVGDGAKGDSGNAGATGSTGARGATGSTGSTGAAGSDATVDLFMRTFNGSKLPTRAPARGLLWNDRGTVKIG